MNKEFTKADLKDGMIVETRDTRRYLVLRGCLMARRHGTLLELYTEDLKYQHSNHDDIMKVFEVKKEYNYFLENLFTKNDGLDLIWERKEAKRMTPEEMRVKLEELTGAKIETEPSRNDMIVACYQFCESRDDSCWGCQFEDSYHGCSFTKLPDKELKECYEKVMKCE